jgi:hypothetical protein
VAASGDVANTTDTQVENWEQKLAIASTRLNELERDYGFYFFASTEEWEGESKSVSQSCANAVNRAFLLYAEAEKLLEEARELRDGAGFLSIDPLEKGLRVLEDKTIEVDTGVPEERRRVFLPLIETYSGTADQVLDDLDTN